MNQYLICKLTIYRKNKVIFRYSKSNIVHTFFHLLAKTKYTVDIKELLALEYDYNEYCVTINNQDMKTETD